MSIVEFPLTHVLTRGPTKFATKFETMVGSGVLEHPTSASVRTDPIAAGGQSLGHLISSLSLVRKNSWFTRAESKLGTTIIFSLAIKKKINFGLLARLTRLHLDALGCIWTSGYPTDY